MDKDKIISQIISEAEAEAKSIINAANAEIDRKFKEDMKLLDEAKERKVNEINKKAAQLKESKLSAVELKARNMILVQKQKIIKDTKKKINETLLELDGKEYVDFIMDVLQKSKLLELDSGIIKLPVKQKTQIINKLAGKFTVSPEEVDFTSGFILIKDNVEYNYVLDTMLEFEKETFDQILAEKLLK